MDAGRALLPGARARAPRRRATRRRSTRRSKARFPPSCAHGTRAHRRSRVGRVQRAVLRAARRRAARRRRDLPARRRSARSSTSRSPAMSRPSLALFGLLLLRFRVAIAAVVAGAAALLPPLTEHSSYPAHRQLGTRALDRRARCRDPRPRPRPALAAALDRSDRCCSRSRATAPGSPCSPPASARSAIARAFRSTLFATGVAASLPALLLFTDARARPARAARERLRAVRRHVVGLHREQLSRARSSSSSAPTSASSGGASGTRRSTSSAACSRFCSSSGGGGETRSPATTLMTAGAVRRRSATCSRRRSFSAFRLELVFVPMAAWGLALANASSLLERGSRARMARRLSNLAARLGGPEPPTLVRPTARRGIKSRRRLRRPLTMRKTATHTQRLWRGFPRGSALRSPSSPSSSSLVQLGGSSAAVNDPPDIVGQWSAPQPWPIVAVHMSLDADRAGVRARRLRRRAQLRAALEPSYGHLHAGPVRAQPVLLGTHPAGRRANAARRRPHQRVRRAPRHDALQRADETRTSAAPDMAEPRWYPTATQLPDGRVLDLRRRPHRRRTGPGQPLPFSDASVNSLPEIYNPTDEHVDEPRRARS